MSKAGTVRNDARSMSVGTLCVEVVEGPDAGRTVTAPGEVIRVGTAEGRITDEAEQHAASIVSDAKSLAGRVRADSERELAAATQRRDSINVQLANVRQMLATLTGAAPVALADDAFASPAKAEADETDSASKGAQKEQPTGEGTGEGTDNVPELAGAQQQGE